MFMTFDVTSCPIATSGLSKIIETYPTLVSNDRRLHRPEITFLTTIDLQNYLLDANLEKKILIVAKFLNENIPVTWYFNFLIVSLRNYDVIYS